MVIQSYGGFSIAVNPTIVKIEISQDRARMTTEYIILADGEPMAHYDNLKRANDVLEQIKCAILKSEVFYQCED